jgi:tetratricopeptide (TPR) repeat protein
LPRPEGRTFADVRDWVTNELLPNLSTQTDVPKYLDVLARAYQRRGDFFRDAKSDMIEAEEDLNLAKRILESSASTKSSPVTQDVYLGLGDLEFELGHVDAALKLYESAQQAHTWDRAYEAFITGAVKQRIGDIYLEDLQLNLAGESIAAGRNAFEDLNVSDSFVTLGGREAERNKLVFVERLGNIGMAGYDQASAILTHFSVKHRNHPVEGSELIMGKGFLASVPSALEFYNHALETLGQLLKADSLYSLRLDQITLLTEIGDAKAAVGSPDTRAMLEKAVGLAEDMDRQVNPPSSTNGKVSTPTNSAVQLALASSRIKLGKLYIQVGLYDLAAEELEQTRIVTEHWRKVAPKSVRWAEALASVDDGLGDIYFSQGQIDQARDSYVAALNIRDELARGEASSAKRRLDLAVSQYELASFEEATWADAKLVDDYRRQTLNLLKELKDAGRLPPIASMWVQLFPSQVQ